MFVKPEIVELDFTNVINVPPLPILLHPFHRRTTSAIIILLDTIYTSRLSTSILQTDDYLSSLFCSYNNGWKLQNSGKFFTSVDTFGVTVKGGQFKRNSRRLLVTPLSFQDVLGSYK